MNVPVSGARELLTADMVHCAKLTLLNAECIKLTWRAPAPAAKTCTDGLPVLCSVVDRISQSAQLMLMHALRCGQS